MVAFATPEDLATFLRRDLSAADTATATQALDLATGVIRRFTRQTISAVPNDALTIYPGLAPEELWLPERPVTGIDSITVDGVTQVSTLYRWRPSGWLEFLAGADWGDVIVVTYDHGYATIPDYIRDICLQAAARAFVNPVGAEAESVGPTQTSYGAVRVSLADDEKSQLADVRRDPLSIRVRAG